MSGRTNMYKATVRPWSPAPTMWLMFRPALRVSKTRLPANGPAPWCWSLVLSSARTDQLAACSLPLLELRGEVAVASGCARLAAVPARPAGRCGAPRKTSNSAAFVDRDLGRGGSIARGPRRRCIIYEVGYAAVHRGSTALLLLRGPRRPASVDPCPRRSPTPPGVPRPAGSVGRGGVQLRSVLTQ
jgi:hypothetical protein